MLKKTTILIFTVTALLLALLLMGCRVTRKTGDDLIFTLKENGTYSVAAAEGFARDTLTVPTEHEGAAVTEIAASGFEGKTSLKTLVIPEGITVIGEGAFASCTHLQDVTIPFLGRTPDENEETEYLGYLFGAASHTENSTVVPSRLNKVTLTGGESISERAFSGCRSLQTLNLPDSVKNIEKGAFAECEAIQSITVPFIGASEADMPNSFLGYFFGAATPFEQKDAVPPSLSSVTLTRGEKLSARAFYECEFLTDINLPDTLKWIGAYAFQGCQYLDEIVIPKSVETIQPDILKDCDYLKTLTVPFIGKNNTKTALLAYFFDSDATSNLDAKIPSSLEKITLTKSANIYGLIDCTRIKDIVLCDGITEIDSNVFYNSTSLRSIYIPGTVTYIASGAFNSLTWLEEVTFGGNSITEIKSGTFQNCTSLKRITLPEGVTTIGKSAFENCDSLTEITIPPATTLIGDKAFYGCNALTTVTIEGDVEKINTNAFADCISLETINFPDTLTHIGYYAFKGCSSLKNVTLPESLTTIEFNAFSGCSSLTEIVIPKGITYIANAAFENCTSLESITLHADITVINTGAFFNATSLKDIYYEGTKEEWDKIKRGGSWMYGAPKPTLHCSDYVEENFYENVSWVGQ